uniref:F-box domain-containing protein n=2 Tax=Schizophyllum commune (strain H4-8 / FGSC 9210) TaxID=578458 RepID=D8QDG3_SCHCM
MNHIPPEILELILLCVAAHEPLHLPPSNFRVYRERFFACPALVLSWVCSRWRAIIISNAAFWAPASIHITLTDYVAREDETVAEHAARKERCIALLKCYLERSRSMPLRQVNLNSYFDDPEDEEHWEPAFGDIVRYIASTAHRWKACTLPGYVVEWLSVTPDAAPDPVLLEFAAIEEKYTGTVYDRLQFFLRAPRLRRWLGDIPSSAAVSRLPWQQLTEIRIWQFMPVQRFMRFIPHCAQLVDLEVSLYKSAGGAPLPPYGTVLLAHLDSATIALDNGEILSSLFATLVTPKLRYLVLNGASPTTQWDLERRGHLCLQRWPTLAFDGWLERSRGAHSESRCTLQGLVLAHIFMPRDDLVWVLENLPDLQDLSLQEVDDGYPEQHGHVSSIDDDVLRRMTVLERITERTTSLERIYELPDELPDRKPELLPELRGLTIAGAIHFDGRRLLDMVKSRAMVDSRVEMADAAPPLEFLCIQPEKGSTTMLDEATQTELRDMVMQAQQRDMVVQAQQRDVVAQSQHRNTLGDKFCYGDADIAMQRLGIFFKQQPRWVPTLRIMDIDIDAMEE